MKTTKARLAQACVSLVTIGLMVASVAEARFDPKTAVGIWLFDEGGGDIAEDFSGNGNNGKLMNDPKWIEGRFGNALQFDGADDYVDVSVLDMTGFSSSTISAWIAPIIPDTGKQVFSSKYDAGNDLRFVMGVQWISANYDDGVEDAVKKLELGWSDDQWHHVAVTQDNSVGAQKLYIDGKEVDSNTGIDGFDYAGLDNVHYIGRRTVSDAKYFDGVIDEVAIFDVALTGSDIRSIMGGMTPVSPGGKLAVSWAGVKAQ